MSGKPPGAEPWLARRLRRAAARMDPAGAALVSIRSLAAAEDGHLIITVGGAAGCGEAGCPLCYPPLRPVPAPAGPVPDWARPDPDVAAQLRDRLAGACWRSPIGVMVHGPGCTCPPAPA